MTAATAATPHRLGLHTRGMTVGAALGLAAIAFTALLPDAVAYIYLGVGFLGAYHESTVLLGVGFLVHGGWDWVHHDDQGPTHVRTWYPPFCVVADVVIGLPLLAGWVL
jgi:hypothetical protein